MMVIQPLAICFKSERHGEVGGCESGGLWLENVDAEREIRRNVRDGGKEKEEVGEEGEVPR